MGWVLEEVQLRGIWGTVAAQADIIGGDDGIVLVGHDASLNPKPNRARGYNKVNRNAKVIDKSDEFETHA